MNMPADNQRYGLETVANGLIGTFYFETLQLSSLQIQLYISINVFFLKA